PASLQSGSATATNAIAHSVAAGTTAYRPCQAHGPQSPSSPAPCACETNVCTPVAVPLKKLNTVHSQMPAKPNAPSCAAPAAPRWPTKIESTTPITVCDIWVSTIG